MRSFFREIKRRNVHRVAIAYLAGSWLLIQILETVSEIYDFDETSIRWVIGALLIAFIPALGISWAFEWTAGGLQSQADIDRGSGQPQASGRTLDRVIIAVLSVAVLAFAADRFLLRSGLDTATAAEPTIAVLPFADLTAAHDQAYFADGLAEELLNILARNPALRVTARTSSFSFRNSDLPIDEIAERLGVAHVLEGSIRRDGDRIRITAQLIAAEDGYHEWSQTYEETLSDIFSVQDSIAARIAEALHASVGGGGAVQSTPTDPQAYTLYLQGNYRARQGSADGWRDATGMYLDSLEIDPDFAPAWGVLASAYVNQAAAGVLEADYAFAEARKAALEAVRLAPDDGTGYIYLAWIAFWYDADLDAALRYTETALRLSPTEPQVIGQSAVIIMGAGRIDEAIRLEELSYERSPVDPVGIYNLALSYRYDDRLADSARMFRRLLQISPDYEGVRYHLGETLLLLGRTEEALEMWEQEPDEAYRLKGLALAHFTLGNRQQADAALAKLIEDYGDRWPSEVVHVYAWRGETDSAFEWLDKELSVNGSGGWGEWKLQRLYDGLRDDPRWEAFLTKIGVSDQQLADYRFDMPELAGT